MKKIFKKGCGVLIALCMALAMLPVTTFADTLTGTINIGGETNLSLGANDDGTGWAWAADTATLTLESTYDGSPISIGCDISDTVNLVYSGDVSLTTDSADTINCAGSLNISESGSGGTLALTNTANTFRYALYVSGTLTISSGTITGSSAAMNHAAVFAGGDITIGENAAVTVTSSSNTGIENYGNIYLSGSLTATGSNAFYAINGYDLFVTGGTLTTAESGYSGKVSANVIVSGGTVNIAGDLSGSLTVTDGTVTVDGDVGYSVTVLGGTVSVNGNEVTPTTNPTLVLDASETGSNPFHLAAVTGPAATGLSGYSWNGASKTLTLSGFTFESDSATALSIVNGDMEIVLASGTENSVTSHYSGTDYTYGISHENDLTISGSGSLTATGGINTSDGYSCGFSSYYGELIVNGGTVTAVGQTAGYSCGINSRGVTVNGGSVTAVGQTAGEGNGLSAGFYLPYGKVTFNGGSLTASGNDYAFFCDAPVQLNASAYTWWTNTEANDPGGEGTDGAVTPFDSSLTTYDSHDTCLFIKLAVPSLTPTPTPDPVVNTDDEDEEEETSSPVTTVKDGDATAAAGISGNYGSETANKTIVSKSDVNKAVSAAVEAAEKNNAAPKVVLNIDTTEKAEKAQVSLPVVSLSKAAKNNIQSFGLVTGIASIAFDNDALKGLSGQATDSDLRISAAKVDFETLSDETKAKIGNASVFEFTIMDGTKAISDFGGGKATVTVPYTLKSGESANGIVVWYLGSDGTLTKIEGTKYDASAKAVTFETTHFSTYAVTYTATTAAADESESVSSASSGSSSETIPDTGDRFAFASVILLAALALGAGITAKKAR